MAKLIGLDGEVVEIAPRHSRGFLRKELRDLVGGERFQIIETNVGTRMAVTGYRHCGAGRELNRMATFLAGRWVIGPAVLFTPGEFDLIPKRRKANLIP